MYSYAVKFGGYMDRHEEKDIEGIGEAPVKAPESEPGCGDRYANTITILTDRDNDNAEQSDEDEAHHASPCCFPS